MTNGIIGEFRVGEDIAIALDATEGNAATVTAISVAMKPALVGDNRLMLDDEAAATALSAVPQAVAGAGWTIALPGAQTALLAPGLYGIDARLTVGGGVDITEQTAFISLTRAALA
ncbi:MAG: hypothetical protein Q8R44_16035 [Novosphingobium sp.]|nr:hypothetical protein [Novosphingobium sp.]